MDMFDVFVSYAHQNRDPVRCLVSRLKEDGYTVWFDEEQMIAGRKTLTLLSEGIERSSHMLVCLSDAYLDRDFTQFEFDANQHIDPANRNNRTIPVVIDRLTKPVPTQMAAFVRSDLSDPDPTRYEQEYQKIARAIPRTRPTLAPDRFERGALAGKVRAATEETRPTMAVFLMGQAAKILCQLVLEKKGRKQPTAGATLDQFADELGKILPPGVFMALKIVRDYGETVVQDDAEEGFQTRESIDPGLAALKTFWTWVDKEFFPKPVHADQDPWEEILQKLPPGNAEFERSIPSTMFRLHTPPLRATGEICVLRGWDTVLRGPVTVQLHGVPKGNGNAFLQEMGQLRNLSTEGIVRPLQSGWLEPYGVKECIFVILEHVVGPTAEDLVNRYGALPPLAACQLVLGMARTLEKFAQMTDPFVHGRIALERVQIDLHGQPKLICVGRERKETVTPADDLQALHRVLIGLLAGNLPSAPEGASRALEDLENVSTATEACGVLEQACRDLHQGGIHLRTVLEAYNENDPIPDPPPISIRLSTPTAFAQLAEFPFSCQKAWPLSAGRILVWEADYEHLAVLEGSDRVWRSTHPFHHRCTAQGPDGQWACASWDGLVGLFDSEGHCAHARLNGAVADIRSTAGHWLAGTWKGALATIQYDGMVHHLNGINEGIFRLAGQESRDQFVVADSQGGLRFYVNSSLREILPPIENLTSMAFAGDVLYASTDRVLRRIEQPNCPTHDTRLPGPGFRLFPSYRSNCCFLIPPAGPPLEIQADGVQTPLASIPHDQSLVSWCRIRNRFVTRQVTTGNLIYWRDGQPIRTWQHAGLVHLDLDGQLLTVTRPGTVELYMDPL